VSAIIILIISEFIEFQTIITKPELVVDRTRRERLKINVDISFHSIPCNLLNMDVMDVVGEQQNDLRKTMHKLRLDGRGEAIGVAVVDEHGHDEKLHSNDTDVDAGCGDCFGGEIPPSGCCNTCEDVRQAYSRKGWSLGDYSKIKQASFCLS
jgi:endoplasmic reticulum-Golgi intermediate compartment protein 3